MTAIIGILCRDGVVIGSDSSATFSDGGHVRTIEQATSKKIEIVGEQFIIAGTGYVGHGQRFLSSVKTSYTERKFINKTGLEVAKILSSDAIKDFQQTHLARIDFSAIVAYPAQDKPFLCELPGGSTGFQPELKEIDNLWFASAGSGQAITDPFLALFREIFWKEKAPNLRGGIFTALWALRHVCDVNTGGIKEPIRIAVLQREGGKWQAHVLTADELAEHDNMVTAGTDHMRRFLNVLEGVTESTSEPPKIQS